MLTATFFFPNSSVLIAFSTASSSLIPWWTSCIQVSTKLKTITNYNYFKIIIFHGKNKVSQKNLKVLHIFTYHKLSPSDPKETLLQRQNTPGGGGHSP